MIHICHFYCYSKSQRCSKINTKMRFYILTFDWTVLFSVFLRDFVRIDFLNSFLKKEIKFSYKLAHSQNVLIFFVLSWRKLSFRIKNSSLTFPTSSHSLHGLRKWIKVLILFWNFLDSWTPLYVWCYQNALTVFFFF